MKRIIDGIHAITIPMSLVLCSRSPGDRRTMGYSLGAPAPADAGYRAIDEADAEKRAFRNDDQSLKVHKFSSGALGGHAH